MGMEVGCGMWFLYVGDVVGGSYLEVTNQHLLSPRPLADFEPHPHAPQAHVTSVEHI